jgi:biopolymer transport protein ExbB
LKGIELNRSNGFGSVWGAVLAAFFCLFLVGGTESTSFAQEEETVTPAPTFDRMPESRHHRESFLASMIHASGIFGFLIMLVSVVMISIIMILGLQLRRDNYLPPSLIEQFEQRLQARDYQGAYDAAKESESFIGRILAAGMSRWPRFEEAESRMQQVGEDETMAMEHKIGYLGLISSIAPMLGLLGTVQGMVYSFQVIANSSTSPKPADLADGIATALFTTLEGLVVAIPAMIFYALYKNRLARFLMECGFVADNLLKDFQSVSQSAAKAGGAGPMGVHAARQE